MIDVTTDLTAPARRPSPWLAESRALLILALPLIGTQLAQMAIMTTDVVLLGRLSTHALAAGAIGNTVYFFCWIVASGPAFAVAPMLAQWIGARPKDRQGVRVITRMGLWAGLATIAPLLPILLSGEAILLAFGQEERLAADAGRFLVMLCFGLPFAMGFGVLRNFATALERPRAALWVMLMAIAFNAVAGWVLIFGHLGFPALGIAGAGLATSASAAFSFFAMVGVIAATPVLRAYRIWTRFHRPNWARFAEVFRLGLPIGITILFEAMLFNTMTLLVGTFGPEQLAAHQIALNFASVTFMVPLGIAMAATVRVGLFAGAGDQAGARRAGLTAMVMGTGLISVFAVVMLVGGEAIAGLYISGRGASDLEVIRLTALFLMVAAAFQVFDGLQVTAGLSLRGLKDARWPMMLAGASYWLAGAPMCVGLGVGLGLEGLGVWIGLAFGLAVAAFAMASRFHLLTRPDRQG